MPMWSSQYTIKDPEQKSFKDKKKKILRMHQIISIQIYKEPQSTSGESSG